MSLVATKIRLLSPASPALSKRITLIAEEPQNLRNLTTIDLGPGSHFLPEDHPAAIGEAIGEWLGAGQ